jgi:hypothetical protein
MSPDIGTDGHKKALNMFRAFCLSDPPFNTGKFGSFPFFSPGTELRALILWD